MTERPTKDTRKFLMGVARRTVNSKDNYFFISADTGEMVSSGYLQGNGDYFSHVPNGTYCIGISKNLKFTYKQLDELIDSAVSLYEEEKRNQEVFEEATELLLNQVQNQVHEFKIYGYEAVEKTVASGNQSSARINVPNSWLGTRVMVVRLE